jgi:hypothetical protein
MKPLFAVFLSTVAICAFVSATPVVAQETITSGPKGEAPITAAPPNTPTHDPLDEIIDAITSGWADTTQPDAGSHVTVDEYRGVP